jgi:hypothetical protein
MVRVLEQCSDDLTRENIMKQAASLKEVRLPMVLPGIVVSTSQDDYGVLKQSRLARFDGTQWNMIDEETSR